MRDGHVKRQEIGYNHSYKQVMTKKSSLELKQRERLGENDNCKVTGEKKDMEIRFVCDE